MSSRNFRTKKRNLKLQAQTNRCVYEAPQQLHVQQQQQQQQQQSQAQGSHCYHYQDRIIESLQADSAGPALTKYLTLISLLLVYLLYLLNVYRKLRRLRRAYSQVSLIADIGIDPRKIKFHG
ncbi:hypothetical protein TKK_0012142 [Trichogramma kaykai]